MLGTSHATHRIHRGQRVTSLCHLNQENNLLSILAWASTRSTWVSASSCANHCGIPYNLVWEYLSDEAWNHISVFSEVAAFYRYDYRIRRRFQSFYISVVSRGYA